MVIHGENVKHAYYAKQEPNYEAFKHLFSPVQVEALSIAILTV
jgi:hypothetical protein